MVLRDGGGCNDMDTGVTEGWESNVPWRPGLSRDKQGAGHLPSSSESAKELRRRRAVLSAPFRTARTEWAALLFSCSPPSVPCLFGREYLLIGSFYFGLYLLDSKILRQAPRALRRFVSLDIIHGISPRYRG